MTILKASSLTKRFGAFEALSGVDLNIAEGEIYGFIGPNGAGKTTTIRILLGILRATSGSAEIFGKDVWRDAVELHRRIAFVPGDVSLWPNLTGGEVIDLFVRLRGNGDKSRREELIQKFELDPSKKCRTYSKGNRQKVALVAAFASDADLYILDEPTSGLDPLMERVFQDCVSDAKNAGKSVLLSSHILSEVERLCDKISIIRQGKIVDTGTLSELRYLTRGTIKAETERNNDMLDTLPGVHDVQRDGEVVTFSVDLAELSNVMQSLAACGIRSLESTPPTLEDLFMRHYEGKELGAK